MLSVFVQAVTSLHDLYNDLLSLEDSILFEYVEGYEELDFYELNESQLFFEEEFVIDLQE